MKDLFLSLNSANRETVREIRRLLEARGISTFLDEEHIRAGLPAIPQIEAALLECQAVAVFLGPALGPWQQREIWVALGRQIEEGKNGKAFPVIPVLLPGGSAGKGFLATNSWVDLRAGLEGTALDALERGVRGDATDFDISELSDLCPFRGLEPFREENSLFFFGRSAVATELVERVEGSKLVAVVGSSGSGKSSVVFAGLIPALRKQRSPRTTWEAVSFSPGNAPFASLARALVEWLEPDLGSTDLVIKAADLGSRLARGEVRLAAFLEKGLETWGAKRLLLVVDQFEELLTQAKPEVQRPFARALLAALDEAKVVIVPTLRGDFYGAACDLDADFSALVERGVLNLRRPSREELHEAVTGPAQLVGLRYEPDLLVEKLLDDVGDEPGNLPLLEYALLELWNQRQDRKLQATAYERMGGLSGAVAASAERAFSRLDAAGQQQARKLFVRLVQTSPTTGGLENTRRRALVEGLNPDARAVIQDFADPEVRLLVTAQDETGKETVEIAHERLITAWQLLRGWLEADIEFRLWRQRLDPSLGYFQKDPANVLTGSALREATGWVERSPDELTAMEREFVDTSLGRAETERIERQHQAEEREDSLRRLAIERKRRARTAMGAAVVSLLLATLAFVGLVRARSATAKARREAARTSFSVAVAALESERADQALPHLAAAIRLDPDWAGPRELALSVLRAAPLARAATKLRVPGYSSDGRFWLSAPEDGSAPWLWDLEQDRLVVALLPPAKPADWGEFSVGGSLLLTTSAEGETQLWNISSGSPVGPRRSHGKDLRASLTPDGRWMITETEEGARIWRTSTGSSVGSAFLHHNYSVRAQLVDNGLRLLTSPTMETLQVWNTATGKALVPSPYSGDGFTEAAISPDGTRIISASHSGTVQTWDARTGKQLGSLPAERSFVLLGGFSSDGLWAATFSSDRAAQLWNVRTGQPAGEPLRYAREVRTGGFSPDARRLVAASVDGAAQIWDVESSKALGLALRSPGPLGDCRFSSDGRQVLAAGSGRRMWWSAPSGFPLAIPLRNELDVLTLAVSPDGQRVLTPAGQSATSWSVRTGLRHGASLLHEGSLNSAAFSPDGRFVVTASSDATARLWNAETGVLVSRLPHQKPVRNAAFSLDGRSVLTTSIDDIVRVWKVASGELTSELVSPERGVLEAVFSPDGRRVATRSALGGIRFWDPALRKPSGVSFISDMLPSDFAFSPTGDRLVVASRGQTLRIWDLTTRTSLGGSLRHDGLIHSVLFSANGSLLASASADGTARIWSAYWRRSATPPLRHRDAVRTAVFSPDGHRLLTASKDGTARLWDVAEGISLGYLMKHDSGVKEAHFAAEGNAVVTLTDDGKAFLWPVYTSHPEEADLIADLAEAASGQVAGPTGLEPIEDWRERQDRVIARVAEAPLGEMSAASLGRWLFMDPWERPVSPLFTLTVEQYICDALRHKAWDEAYRYFPGHPLLGKGPEDPLPAACAAMP